MSTKERLQAEQRRLSAMKRRIEAAFDVARLNGWRSGSELEGMKRRLGHALVAEALCERPNDNPDDLRGECRLLQRSQEEAELVMAELKSRHERVTEQLQDVGDRLADVGGREAEAKKKRILEATSHVKRGWGPVRMRQEFDKIASQFGVATQHVESLWHRHNQNVAA